MGEIYYSPINQPKTVRSSLLNNAKLIVECLKGFNSLKDIRAEKIKYLFELRRLVEELSVLNKKLKEKFPKTSAKPGDVVPGKIVIKKGEKIIREDVLSSEKNRIQILEEELSKIESKLSSLE